MLIDFFNSATAKLATESLHLMDIPSDWKVDYESLRKSAVF